MIVAAGRKTDFDSFAVHWSTAGADIDGIAPQKRHRTFPSFELPKSDCLAHVWIVIEESVAEGEWSIEGSAPTFAAMQALEAGRDPWNS